LYHGVCSLLEYEGTLNAACYQDLIAEACPSIDALFENRKWYFQQDGASAHRAASTIEFLKKIMLRFIPKEDWPPNSPDLSPIENLWVIIDAQVKEQMPSTVPKMQKMIFDAWNSISNEICTNLTNSMHSHLQACIDNHGGYTKY